MSKWQPIETAPKDGTWVLVRSGVKRTVIAKWSKDWGGWIVQYSAMGISRATHWMPLPPQPEEV